ncbi:MAG: HAMP domain-containing protein, partial [Spirochaetales bacterium]|nr:HAMP domain-containing protein [Spirochaetales bacterium]
GAEAAAAFAERGEALLTNLERALETASRDPILLPWFGDDHDPATAAEAMRRLNEIAAASDAHWSLALLDIAQARAIGTHALPSDWDMAAYDSWGIFRRSRAAPGTAASSSRRRIAQDGTITVMAWARAVSVDGRTVGFAASELMRSGFEAAVRGAGSDLAGARVVDPDGLIAFELRDPALEGSRPEGTELPPRGERAFALVRQGFTWSISLSATPVDEASAVITAIGIAGGGAGVLLAALLAFAASRGVTRPVLRLSAAMSRIEAGDLSVRVEPDGDDELGALGRSFNAMAAELEALVRAAVERQELLRKAELRALAAQMDPHFLRNTLASIKSLAKLGRAAEISDLVSRLGRLLKPAIEARTETASLAESLERARDYLAVERVRLGERLAVEEDVEDAALGAELPSLALETLVENALLHGIERKRGAGRLRIEARVRDGAAFVGVEDDGPGMRADELESLVATLSGETGPIPESGRGVGLANTARRIRLLFGTGWGITVLSPAGGGFRAELRVPAPAGEPSYRSAGESDPDSGGGVE